jgi:hypothetical protein
MRPRPDGVVEDSAVHIFSLQEFSGLYGSFVVPRGFGSRHNFVSGFPEASYQPFLKSKVHGEEFPVYVRASV